MRPPCQQLPTLIVPLVLSLAVLGCQAVSKPKQPAGHFLTPSELTNISSVACLEAKQKDPTAECENVTEVTGSEGSEFEFSGAITTTNYPNYRSQACHSDGAYFCDPTNSMDAAERANLTIQMGRLRERDRSLVVCGALLNDPVDRRHLQPFYLGVAVLPAWPADRSSPETLQQMGELIDAEWDMDQLYLGHPVPLTRCPTTAVLLLLPESKQAFLSSGSCDFLCASKGGAAVVSKAEAALNAAGSKGPSAVYAAALAGAAEAYDQLALRRGKPWDDQEAAVAAAAAAAVGPSNDFYLSNLLQRLAFAFAVICLAGAFALGLAVLLVGPGLIARRGKWDTPP